MGIVRDLVKSSLASLGALSLSFITVEAALPAAGLQGHLTSRFTLVLFLSLMYQTILVRFIPQLYKEDIYFYSESLAKYHVVEVLCGRIGPKLTAVCIYFANYGVGITVVGGAMVFGPLQYEILTFVLLSLSLAFMIDPVIAFILRSNKSMGNIALETGPVLMGYAAVLLIGIGAIPVEVIDGGIYPYLLALCWMSARMAFTINFAFNRKQDILVFGPSIIALFIAVGPNLILITNQL